MSAGAGFNALAQAGAQAGLDQIQRKRNAADEERLQRAGEFIDTGKTLRANMAAFKDEFGKVKPEYQDQYDKAQESLAQVEYGFNQLYHPIKAPGKIQEDWHYLVGKLHGILPGKGKGAVATQLASTPPAAPPAPGYQKTMGVGPSGNAVLPPVTPENGGMQTPNTPGFGPVAPGVGKGATPTMAVANPKGLAEAGNIPIWNRPSVLNDDGTHSSELSISMQDDKGNQVLIPLIVGGKFLTPDGKMPPGSIPHNAQEWEKASPEWKALRMRAWQHYEKTGEHLGKFGGDTAEDDVDAYTQVLHNRGAAGANSDTTHTPAATAPAPKVSWGQAQVLKQRAASMQKAQQEAALLASGAPLSPQQEAMSKLRTDQLVKEAQINESLRLAEKLGITGPALEEFKQQLVGLKNVVPKAVSGPAGQPYKGSDGRYYKPVLEPDGITMGSIAMPPDWKPNTKSVAGTVINTKQHGWIKTWVDPYTQQVTGWQPFTPGRTLTGSTSTSSSTDPFGLTTSTSRSTMPTNAAPRDFDFSGIQQLPENFNGDTEPVGSPSAPPVSSATSNNPVPGGSPNKSPAPTAAPPKSVSKSATGPTPAQLRKKIPAPPSVATTPQAASGKLALDATGHIPTSAPYNPNLIGAANQLIDGMDITKLTIPQKAKEAASNLARAYGWAGQGMFTPREALQLKEGASFLNLMANSPTLKVLDDGFFKNIPMTGSSNDPAKEGFFGKLLTNVAARNQTPEQQKFMDLYRQLDAMAIGLRALVQTGRGTQKQTDLLISELPNPYNTPSSADAKRRLSLVQKELDIAAKTGHLPEFEEMQKDFNSQNPHQHKVGDWVMLGDKKVQIKKLNDDGTFEY